MIGVSEQYKTNVDLAHNPIGLIFDMTQNAHKYLFYKMIRTHLLELLVFVNLLHG